MGAPSKRAKKIRQGAEFDIARVSLDLRPPKEGPSAYSWTLEEIYNARTDQMLGRFRRPARLAESMRTDDALFTARTNRLAPQIGLEVELVPAKARGEKIASEADALYGAQGIGVTTETVVDIHGCLVDHGVAFAQNIATPREDGSRVDFAVRAWPIEFVRWDAYDRCFKTQTDGGVEEAIVHGDGRWIVFAKNEIEPFKHGVIVPGSIVWARHAHAIRDWAKGSVSHGSAKVVGEMPAGVALQDAAGPTPEAAAFLDLLKAMVSGDLPVGIRPAGAKTEFLTNTSTAWQVWNELAMNGEKAAARIYLGTDGTLGANGGAPGVDIGALFGVASTLVEGDLECIEKALKTGSIDVWCAMNFGTSELAPARRYVMPDADSDADSESYAKRNAAFFADMKAARDANVPIDQAYVDDLAKKYRVRAPVLPVAAPAAAPAPVPPPAALPALRAAR